MVLPPCWRLCLFPREGTHGGRGCQLEVTQGEGTRPYCGPCNPLSEATLKDFCYWSQHSVPPGLGALAQPQCKAGGLEGSPRGNSSCFLPQCQAGVHLPPGILGSRLAGWRKPLVPVYGPGSHLWRIISPWHPMQWGEYAWWVIPFHSASGSSRKHWLWPWMWLGPQAHPHGH